MSREDFISDNLVDMREKLRRNYAVMNAQIQKGKENSSPEDAPAEAASSRAPLPETPSATPAAAKPAATPLPPPLPRSASPDDLERAKRELEGALHRDHARLLRELELLRVQTEELETFFSSLKDFLGELEHTSERRQLDLLRLRYLEAQGRALAFLDSSSAAPRSAQEEPRTMGRIFAEGLPYLLGALLSALIIALAIAFVF